MGIDFKHESKTLPAEAYRRQENPAISGIFERDQVKLVYGKKEAG
jgi:hypothetical protein